MIIKDGNGKVIDIEKYEDVEQKMAKKYIQENDIVLELGARYGSVSCTINSILKNKTNQVSVEPDPSVWDALESNRALNNCKFNILKGVIGLKKYIFSAQGLGSYIEETTGDSNVKVYSLSNVVDLYKLKFNVLIVDCEGCLENFVDENSEFFDNLRMVFFEADRGDICNYEKIRKFLKNKGFVEKEILPYGNTPNFYNVWLKTVEKYSYVGIF